MEGKYHSDIRLETIEEEGNCSKKEKRRKIRGKKRRKNKTWKQSNRHAPDVAEKRGFGGLVESCEACVT
jgi:hypothetical protein